MESVLENNIGEVKMEARTLDRTRDFSEVFGLPGVRYTQDGFSFNAGGFEIDATILTPINHEKPKPSPRDDTPIHVAFTSDKTEEASDALAIEHLDENRLKALVESYGETYKGRNKAIKFLKGGK